MGFPKCAVRHHPNSCCLINIHRIYSEFITIFNPPMNGYIDIAENSFCCVLIRYWALEVILEFALNFVVCDIDKNSIVMKEESSFSSPMRSLLVAHLLLWRRRSNRRSLMSSSRRSRGRSRRKFKG